MQAVRDQNILRCTQCSDRGPIKPDIVFFGENLPQAFHETAKKIKLAVDLVLVMGTALAVTPFSYLPNEVKDNVPRVLFNLNNTTESGGIDFTEGPNKLFVQGKCDETLTRLAEDCGWADDFQAVLPEVHK